MTREFSRGRYTVLLVEPLIPLPQTHEFVFDSVCTVLTEHFIDGPRQAFGVGVRERLLVVEKKTRVVVSFRQSFEVFRVTSSQNCVVFATPLQQFSVGGVLSEPIFRLLDAVTTLAEQSLEDATDVFTEENPCSRHWIVSFGFSDDSRTWSNAF